MHKCWPCSGFSCDSWLSVVLSTAFSALGLDFFCKVGNNEFHTPCLIERR